jgi:hypothetical protein
MTRASSFVAAMLIVATSLIAFTGTAAAHERRTLGPYQLVVGWLNEPAYVGIMNSFDLRVTDTRVTPARPVEGLEKTLTVDLRTGGLAPLALTLTARFGVPGAYNAYVMPTATGTYVFALTGKIESLDVNEQFESGPGRFGDIESTDALQYPSKVPVADDLGKRLSDLQGTVDQARIVALVALAVGIIALGGAALMGRRRT